MSSCNTFMCLSVINKILKILKSWNPSQFALFCALFCFVFHAIVLPKYIVMINLGFIDREKKLSCHDPWRH